MYYYWNNDDEPTGEYVCMNSHVDNDDEDDRAENCSKEKQFLNRTAELIPAREKMLRRAERERERAIPLHHHQEIHLLASRTVREKLKKTSKT